MARKKRLAIRETNAFTVWKNNREPGKTDRERGMEMNSKRLAERLQCRTKT